MANLKKLFSFLLIMSVLSIAVNAAPDTKIPKSIYLETGESVIFNIEKVSRVAVGDPQIADIKVISNKQIMLVGKSGGGTTIHIWSDTANTTHQVVVYPRKYDSITQEVTNAINIPGLTVSSSGSSITINGEVETTLQKANALRIASQFGKEVVDMIRIHIGPSQIQVHVKMVEVSKEIIRETGLDWRSGTSSGITGLINAVTSQNITNDLLSKIRLWTDEGKAKMLAEPTLVTLSGSSASFLAGGEVPIPINIDGQTSIQWKPYGVSLIVTPKTTSDGELLIKIRPEVSTLDWSSTTASSMNMPAVKKRWAETELKVASGKSIVIAGLLQNEETRVTSKLPVLGDLPLIGELFKSTKHTNKESELLVVVTPSFYNQLGDKDVDIQNSILN